MIKYLIILLLLFPLQSRAIIEFEDAAFPELVTSARALGLGNVYMSKVDDSWASFYNPAGLGTVRHLITQIANVHLEVNNGFLDATSGEGSFTKNAGNFSKAMSATGMKELLVENPGVLSHTKYSLFPNITYRGLTLGYMYTKTNRARLESASADLEFAERLDYGPVLAFSFSLFGGIIKFGASAIYLTREQLQKDFAPTDEVEIEKDVDYQGGNMTYVTVGGRITLPFKWLPTFSGVLRNGAGVEFSNPEYSGVPDPIPRTMDASFSLTPFTGRTSRLHFEVGMKDIRNFYTNVPQQRKMGLGVELDWRRMMFFRMGYGDGWGSGGIGVRAKSFVFDLTSYAVEQSEDGVREKEDRRTVLSFSSGF